jgi:hypothetical protein
MVFTLDCQNKLLILQPEIKTVNSYQLISYPFIVFSL